MLDISKVFSKTNSIEFVLIDLYLLKFRIGSFIWNYVIDIKATQVFISPNSCISKHDYQAV